MSRQHHYVIYYDTDTQAWDFEPDREERAFPEYKTIWDTETQKWYSEADLWKSNDAKEVLLYQESTNLTSVLIKALKEVHTKELVD